MPPSVIPFRYHSRLRRDSRSLSRKRSITFYAVIVLHVASRLGHWFWQLETGLRVQSLRSLKQASGKVAEPIASREEKGVRDIWGRAANDKVDHGTFYGRACKLLLHRVFQVPAIDRKHGQEGIAFIDFICIPRVVADFLSSIMPALFSPAVLTIDRGGRGVSW